MKSPWYSPLLSLRRWAICGRRVLKFLLCLCGLALLGFCVLFLVAYLIHKSHFMRKDLHQALGVLVHFNVDRFAWNHGAPELDLSDIAVASIHTPQLPAVQIKTMQMQFDLWSMLRYLKPATRWIHFSGVQIFVQKTSTGSLQFRGFPLQPLAHATHIDWLLYWPHCWAWLQPQQQIHIAAQLFVTGHKMQPVPLHMDFMWQAIAELQHSISLVVEDTSQASHPVHLQIKGLFWGSLLLPTTFTSHFYIAAKGVAMSAVVNQLRVLGLHWQSKSGHLQLWGDWQAGHLNRLHGLFNVGHLTVSNTQRHVHIVLPKFHENIEWKASAAGWSLLMNPYTREVGKGIINDPTQAFLIDVKKQAMGARWRLYASDFQVSLLSQLLQIVPQLSQRVRRVLAGTAPQGRICKLSLAAVQHKQSWQDVQLYAHFLNVSIQAWQGWPAVGQLSGTIHASGQHGILVAQAAPLTIGANAWFTMPWPRGQFHLVARWLQTQQGWRVFPTMRLQNQSLNMQLHGGLFWPQHTRRSPTLGLLATGQVHQLQKRFSNYLPSYLFDQHFDQWLKQAIVKLPNGQFSFIFRGPLPSVPFRQAQGVMSLQAKTSSMIFRPDTGWPVVTQLAAQVGLYGDTLTVKAQQGHSLGAAVKSVEVVAPHLSAHDPTQVTVQAHVKGSGQQAQHYITQSPLEHYLQGFQSYFHVSGAVGLDLKLQFPLHQPTKRPQFSGVVHLSHNTVRFIQTPIVFHQVSGDVQFLNAGVFAKRVTSTLWGQPIHVRIESHGDFYDLAKLHESVMFQGHLNFASLAQAFDFPFASRVLGVSTFSAYLRYQHRAWSFAFESSLKGVELNFPAPFSLRPSMIMPVSLTADLKNPDSIPVALQLGNLLSGRLWFAHRIHHESFQKGYITLGLKQSQHVPKVTSGLSIVGIVPYLSLAQWQPFFLPYLTRTTSKESSATHKPHNKPMVHSLHQIDLQIGDLNAYGYDFNHIDLQVKPTDTAWDLAISGTQAAGHMQIARQYPFAVNADFSRLHIHRTTSTSSAAAHTSKTTGLFSRVKPYLKTSILAKWPPLHLQVAQLTWEDRSLGQLLWQSKPLVAGIRLQHFHLKGSKLTADLQGSMHTLKSITRTDLKGNVTSQDWGHILDVLGYAGFLQQGKGNVAFALNWLGAASPDLSTLNGEVAFQLKEGALLSVKPGLAKLLGLTDITSLFQRLQLNAQNVGNKGLAFDQLSGKYVLYEGVASTKKVMLSGPALDLLMKGSVDLMNKRLHQTVIVIPHLGGGVALAAGLLGGPIAAVAAWVGEKVLTSTVLKNKGMVYHVSGSWDHPKIVNSGNNLVDKQ